MEPSIIWISSYPKSGNTMMRLFLASYFFTKNGKLENFTPLKKISSFNHIKNFEKITNFPSIKHFQEKPEMISRYWQKAQVNINEKLFNKILFLKTHNAQFKFNSNFFTNNELTRSFIYVVRDPRSVLLSSISHYGIADQISASEIITSDKRLSYATDNGRLPEFLLSWRTHFVSWHNFAKSNPDLGLIIKYEDLVLKSEETFLIVLKFLLKKTGQRFDMAKFKNAFESINFLKIKKMEKKIGFFEKSENSDNFFRLGKVDEWKEKLNLEINSNIKRAFSKEMKYLGYI